MLLLIGLALFLHPRCFCLALKLHATERHVAWQDAFPPKHYGGKGGTGDISYT